MRIYIVLIFFLTFTTVYSKEYSNDKLLSLDATTGISYIGGKQINPRKRGKYNNVLLKIDFNEKIVKKISGPWSGDKHSIKQVELSPDGNYLTLIDHVSNKMTLYLIDTKTDQVVNSISDKAIVYDWHPQSKAIVYINGTFDPTKKSRAPFISDGVQIYSLESNENTKIYESGYQILWATHDENIYIDTIGYFKNKIIKLRPDGLIKNETQHKDLNFSLSGKYYCNVVKDEAPIYTEIFTSIDDNKIYSLYGETYIKGAGHERNCIWSYGDLLTLYSANSFFSFDILKGTVFKDQRNKRINGKYTVNKKYLVSISRDNFIVVYNNGFWELQNLQTGRLINKVKSGIE